LLPLGCAVGAAERSEAAIFPKPVEYQAKDPDQKIVAFGSSYHDPAEREQAPSPQVIDRSHAPAWECRQGRSAFRFWKVTQSVTGCISTRERGSDQKYLAAKAVL